jgi:MYXO-CTERM domain-containing protein
MRRQSLVAPAFATLLVVGSADSALTQTTTGTPDVVVDDNGDDDFDWGWLGLLGLAGLAGLYRKREPVRTTTTSGSVHR